MWQAAPCQAASYRPRTASSMLFPFAIWCLLYLLGYTLLLIEPLDFVFNSPFFFLFFY